MKKHLSYLFILLFISFASCSDDKEEFVEQEEIHGKYYDGVFVLNEGNMTSENGSLVFIDNEGTVEDDAYKLVNDMELGNSAQDLFIANGRIYLLTQNGARSDSEGILTVANAETLEKIVSYDEQVKTTLSWPTHLAVVDGEVFIRDNNGIYLFNEADKSLTFIEGSKGAEKMTMAVVNKKVFAAAGNRVLVLEKGMSTVSKEIKFDQSVSAVVKSHDAKLWVSTSAGNVGTIAKINPSSYATEKKNDIEYKVSSGWAASAGITAKQDTIYFSNLTSTIYRHVFATGETKMMIDAKTLIPEHNNMVYNTIAVHPKSGEVYINTIDGYGTYRLNNISVINFHGKEPKLRANYKDHTRFPAGIFFPANFR